MLQALSYPSLRVVLEQLEASKRFHISARCSTISRFDKTIPLRIDRLQFADNTISLNRIIFQFGSISVLETEEQARRRIQESLTPGDILLDYKNDERIIKVEQIKYLKYSDDYQSQRQRYTRRLPKNVTPSDALKTLSNFILEQRKDIKVAHLNIWNHSQNVLRLPQNIQFQVRGLRAAKNDVKLLKQIVDPSCFPLVFIRVEAWKEEYSEDSFLQSSNELIIILDCKEEQFLEKLIKHVKKRFRGNVVNFKSMDELQNIVILSNVVSIPLDSDKELVVYGYQYEKNWNEKVTIYLRLVVFQLGLHFVPIEKKKFLGLPWFS